VVFIKRHKRNSFRIYITFSEIAMGGEFEGYVRCIGWKLLTRRALSINLFIHFCYSMYCLASIHSVTLTDRQTDGQTDIIVPIADHTAACSTIGLKHWHGL